MLLGLNFPSIAQEVSQVEMELLIKQDDGLYYAPNEKAPLSGTAVSYYADGKIRSKLHCEKGKQVGDWEFWNPSGNKLQTGKVVDIDGNTYKTIKIGDDWWMAENLIVIRLRNGDKIQKVEEDFDWLTLSHETMRLDVNPDLYSAYSEYGGIYLGNYYNWYAVADSRGLAPEVALRRSD